MDWSCIVVGIIFFIIGIVFAIWRIGFKEVGELIEIQNSEKIVYLIEFYDQKRMDSVSKSKYVLLRVKKEKSH